MDVLKPDIAFDESTLFHESLVIEQCRKSGILYLHPTSCRYPPNRFSFFQYDSLTAVGRSREKMLPKKGLEFIDKIKKRAVVPDYLEVNPPKTLSVVSIMSKLRITAAYLLGERFNTPSPLVKMRLEKHKQ